MLQDLHVLMPIEERLYDILKNSKADISKIILLDEKYGEIIRFAFEKIILKEDIRKKNLCLIVHGPKSSGKTSVFDLLGKIFRCFHARSKINNFDVKLVNPHQVKMILFNEIDWFSFLGGYKFRDALVVLEGGGYMYNQKFKSHKIVGEMTPIMINCNKLPVVAKEDEEVLFSRFKTFELKEKFNEQLNLFPFTLNDFAYLIIGLMRNGESWKPTVTYYDNFLINEKFNKIKANQCYFEEINSMNEDFENSLSIRIESSNLQDEFQIKTNKVTKTNDSNDNVKDQTQITDFFKEIKINKKRIFSNSEDQINSRK